jgi:thiol-disulfide isomerase/thioredoxin
MEVYRGEETIDGPSVGFYAVLDQSKPVVLNFWTGLCPPCRAQTPDFQRLYDADGDKFIMLEVDVGLYVGLGTRQDVLDFLEEFDITYPTARPLTFPAPRGSMDSIGCPPPCSLLLKGKIFSSRMGLLPEKDRDHELLRLLQASGEGF